MNRNGCLASPESASILYSYDINNNLSRVDYSDGTGKIYHYEKPSFPNHLTGISFIDSTGAVSRYATYDYDTTGRAVLTQHTDVGNGGPQEKFTLVYNSSTQTTVTNAINNNEILTFSINLGVKNLVSKVNVSDNKSLTQTFDSNNNINCKKDEEGRVTTYTYYANNQKSSQTEGQSGTCAAPLPTTATRTTSYQYLAADLDLPTLIETPSVYAGSTKRVSIHYDTNHNPDSITQSGYTPTGTAVARTVGMSYNAYGQVTSIDGPRTDVADITTLAYNECTTGGGCGQLKRVTNALGQVTTYDNYDANGRLLQMTDPNGVKTVYTYYPRGWVQTLTQTAPGGGSRMTSYGYDAAGNVTSTSLPTGLTLSYTYDAANYLRRVTDSYGNHIDYGYDLKGNRTQTYTYDASGTLVRSVDLAFDVRNHVNQINTGGSITQQIADALGNLTQITDPNTVAASGSAATSNNYDALNRLYQTIDRMTGSTLYSYDANDRLQTVQAPNGASTQYQYDDLGNLLQESSPDRGTVLYRYDTAGNLKQQTDARGIVSKYSYDALNRLTYIDYASSTENVTYTYDSAAGCTFGLGRLCSVVDESGGTAYAYDAFGNRLVQTHVELGVTYNTFYTYDAGNRVTSITYPDGRVVNTPRDALGRITDVTGTVNGSPVTIASSRSFRPDGLLLGQTFGNGLNEVRQYDTQGRMNYQSLASADTRVYSYDPNGNLKGLQSLPLVGVYGYDALDRLNLDQRTTTATTSSTFTFDANGNRKTENLGSYAYLANSNRLQSTPQGSISLDPAGNTLSDGLRSYTYNNAGQVSTVAGAGYSYNAQRLRSRKLIGSVGTVYHYDASGNLLTETDLAGKLQRAYVWADGEPLAQIEPVTILPPDILVDNPQATFTGTWATSTSITGFYGANYRTHAKGTGKNKAVWTLNVPTTGTYQVYARWVAASTNASNAPFTVKYSGGSKAISVNQRASGGQWMLLGSFAFTAGTAGSVTLTDNANGTVIADAVKLAATTGGTTSEVVRYLHTDHLHTPRLATNQQAQVIWRWEGEAFGGTYPNEDVDGDGKLTTINLRFAGQYYDAETGLHYNWNRYYDPKTGRYVTSDPIGLGGGLNTYAYVAENPLVRIDPLGLRVEWSGSISGGSLVSGGGAGGWYFEFTSECKCNKIVRIQGFISALGGGAAIGAPKDVSGSGGSVRVHSNDECPDPGAGNGGAGLLGVNVIPGVGFSIFSKVRVGRLWSDSEWFSGPQYGLDLGAAGFIGASAVTSYDVKPCCDKK
jgi:RHS repeat-associated protein